MPRWSIVSYRKQVRSTLEIRSNVNGYIMKLTSQQASSGELA